MNVYYTPKGEQLHGFGLHTDNTDGFIVQVSPPIRSHSSCFVHAA